MVVRGQNIDEMNNKHDEKALNLSRGKDLNVSGHVMMHIVQTGCIDMSSIFSEKVTSIDLLSCMVMSLLFSDIESITQSRDYYKVLQEFCELILKYFTWRV